MCDRCHLLEGLLHDAETSMSAIGEEVQVLTRSLKTQGRQLIHAERELREALEADPTSETVKAILSHWRDTLRGGSKRVSIKLDGDRAKVVRRALKSLTSGSEDERAQTCMDAISGLGLRPYVGPKGGRIPTDVPGARRFDDIQYALGDETRIESNREYWKRAQLSDLQRKRLAFDQQMGVMFAHLHLLTAQAAKAGDWRLVEMPLLAMCDGLMRALGGIQDARERHEEEAARLPSLDNPTGRTLFVVPDPESGLSSSTEEAA